MALNPTPVGDAIAAFVQTVKPTDGVPVSDAQLKVIWEGIVKIIYDDLKANMEVLPGTFTTSAGAVTGLGGPAQ